MDGLDEFCKFTRGVVGCPITSGGDAFVKEGCNLVVCFSGVDQSEGFPPADDLLLRPLVGLSEVVVDSLVDCVFKAVERGLRLGLEQVVQREIQGVSDEENHFVVL